MDTSAVLRGLPHAVLVVAPDGTVRYANAAAELLVGVLVDGAPLAGVPALDLVLPASRPRAVRLLESVVDRSGGPAQVRLAGAQERWVAVRGAPGERGEVVLSLTEVTGEVLARRRLRRSEHRFRAAFEAAAHGTALVSERGHVVTTNPALAQLLGRSREDLAVRHVAELVDPPEGGPADWTRQGTVARRLRHAGGELVDALVTVSPVQGDEGERLYLVQVQDVTERRRSEQRLQHLALHDQLTDLPARHLLLERLEGALQRRSPAAPLVAALFVDLDEFKLVNDALGHEVGDLVLRETAARLRAVTRPQDTVARLSGDEFVVVCPALGGEDEAVAIADRLSEALRPPVVVGEDEVLVSASIGVAFSTPGETSAAALLRDADAAMYRAKQLGRRRYEVFDTALRDRALERGRLRALLARALEDDVLEVHYQPVVDVRSRRAVGVEALLRLRDPERGLLGPAAFLDVAVDSGLLPALDEHVLATAAPLVARWSAELGAPLGLAVNLGSGRADPGLADRVQAVLAAAGLPPERLLVEVTERVLTAAVDDPAPALRALVERGVRLGLDDFGAGSGSLTCLRVLPVSVLKVDRSFVALLPEDGEGLVPAVVALARSLGLAAVAEGVESEAQFAALRAEPPAYAQGWLFGGPVPAAEVPAALRRLGVEPVADGWPLRSPRGRQPDSAAS